MTGIYWLEQCATQVPELDDWLAPREAATLAGLRIRKRRQDWRLGRWTAKQAVSVYLGTPCDPRRLAEIEIRAAASGAPEVFLCGEPAPLAISLSHRAGLGLCIVGAAGGALGCDLEIIEPRSRAFLEQYFTPDEQAQVASAPASDRDRLVTLFWSAKESVLKALHVGLRASTTSVSVQPLEGEESRVWQPYSAQTSGGTFRGWWRESGGMLRALAGS